MGIRNSFIFGLYKDTDYKKKLLTGLNTTLGSIYNYNNIYIGGTYGIENYYNSKIKLAPNNFTIGLGYGKNNKWKLNLQYSWNYSKKNEYYDIKIEDQPSKPNIKYDLENTLYKEKQTALYYNINKFSLGGYFLSNNKMLIYRGGLYI